VLRRSEAELSTALQIAKLGYWEYDVEKDFFLFNDHFYSIFHTTAEREGGYQLSSAQYAQKFVHPDDLPVVGTEIERALNSTDRHYSRQLEHRILYADGGVGYISVSINIDRDEQGHVLRYYGANQDITDRKRIEQQMEETLHETERLYAAVSHEGWQTYRQTSTTGDGYLFDRALVQSADEVWEPEIAKALDQRALATSQAGQRAVAVAPLSVRGEAIGALGVYDDPAHPLGKDDLQLIEAVSEQVALALKRPSI
jgi:PAS domain S-box-containing protein